MRRLMLLTLIGLVLAGCRVQEPVVAPLPPPPAPPVAGSQPNAVVQSGTTRARFFGTGDALPSLRDGFIAAERPSFNVQAIVGDRGPGPELIAEVSPDPETRVLAVTLRARVLTFPGDRALTGTDLRVIEAMQAQLRAGNPAANPLIDVQNLADVRPGERVEVSAPLDLDALSPTDVVVYAVVVDVVDGQPRGVDGYFGYSDGRVFTINVTQ